LERVAEFLPLYDEVARCNRCGFCQPTCPIYRVTGKEGSVARGHHAQVRAVIEGRLPFTPRLKTSFFECLLCRACVANCFPAVKTHQVMVAARAAYRRRFGQPRLERLLFHQLLPSPSRMRLLLKLAALGKLAGLSRLAQSLEILGWFGKRISQAGGMVQDLPLRSLREEVGRRVLPSSGPRGRVAYFFSCGFDLIYPRVGEATLQLLERCGYGIQLLPNLCCGLPPYSYGDLQAAAHLARQNLLIFREAEVEAIVTDCSSCSSFLKEYPQILEDHPDLQQEARSFSQKVRDLSEFLRAEELPRPLNPFSHRVTFHDPCHLSRYQGLAPRARALLRAVPGLDFVEMPEADWCCGAAGSYHLVHYDQSMKVLERKLNNLEKTGAEILSTSCPSCMMQLSFGMRSRGYPGRVMHLAEILQEATSPPG